MNYDPENFLGLSENGTERTIRNMELRILKIIIRKPDFTGER